MTAPPPLHPGEPVVVPHRRLLTVGLVVTAVSYALAASAWALGWPGVGLVAGGVAIAGLAAYGLHRRSLTAWILISMVVGAEIGHDWPAVGTSLRLLSQIFLRMIKTIIAPLLFATLVVGIAGHPNLKQVGRMGIKALVYFEVVTTIALFIGLAAINLSRAGVGITLPPTAKTGDLAAQK